MGGKNEKDRANDVKSGRTFDKARQQGKNVGHAARTMQGRCSVVRATWCDKPLQQ